MLHYRVLCSVESAEKVAWTLLRDGVRVASFASNAGAEAEGRKRALADCENGLNACLVLHSAEGDVEDVVYFSQPDDY